MKKILILKSDKDDFERYFIKKMNNTEIDCFPIYKKRNKFSYYLSVLWIQYFHLPMENIWYGRWKKKIHDYDLIIVFDRILSWKIINYLRSKNERCKIIAWYWNAVNTTIPIPDFKNDKNFEIWSFNEADCKKYNLKFNNQFYFSDLYNKALQDKDTKIAYFIGKDKGRYQTIKKIKDVLEDYGLICNIYIVKDETSVYDSELYINHLVDYNEILNSIDKSDLIIDIPQESQTGITLRILEGLFRGKKIITTNKSLDKDLLNLPQIFLWDNNYDELKNFLNKEIEVNLDIDERIQKYKYENWVKRF
ncbi:hypothetical protein [uncultured Dubosiella sp.]|uniref:hypothetical protein n=1 Tax=uncultured Dubosiella sp. TaxID=1937011 RepID=UPI0026281F04|nr:hypothetical protein [uncultured Dubosiella sp.]